MDMITLAMAKAYSDRKGGYIVPGKVYTFDGNLEGKRVIDSEFGTLVKISDNPNNFGSLKTLSARNGNENWSRSFEIAGDGGLYGVAVDGTIYVISFDESYSDNGITGLYFVYHSETHYATKVEFAETIHPIDPKYLPPMGGGSSGGESASGGLPTIELETEIVTVQNGTTALSETDSIAVEIALASRSPAIVGFVYNGIPRKAVFDWQVDSFTHLFVDIDSNNTQVLVLDTGHFFVTVVLE